jgi:hypothetical protein
MIVQNIDGYEYLGIFLYRQNGIFSIMYLLNSIYLDFFDPFFLLSNYLIL